MTIFSFVLAYFVAGICCYCVGYAIGSTRTIPELAPSIDEQFRLALREGLLTKEDLLDIGIDPHTAFATFDPETVTGSGIRVPPPTMRHD